ncbi:hypothetical protein ACWDKQ_26785 [Saccharopolyspora sp. NPDC000995]
MLVGLKLTDDATSHLDEQAAALDAAWHSLGARISTTAGDGRVRVEPGRDGRAQIRVDKLEKLDEAPSLLALRDLTEQMMPQVDLPELLLEVHARTGYLSEFTHASGGESRMDDAELSLGRRRVIAGSRAGRRSHQRRLQTRGPTPPPGAEPATAVAHRAELRARRNLAGRQRPPDRGLGRHPPGPALGRRHGRLGGRAAVRRPCEHRLRRPQPALFRAPQGRNLAECDQ